MPAPGKRWRHIICNTHRNWLPGDARGFRNREHRIHSSGNYKNPPPPEEHYGLMQHHHRDDVGPFVIPIALRQVVGHALRANLAEHQHRVGAIAVTGRHLHVVVELPNYLQDMNRVVNWCKWHATRAMNVPLGTKVWARGFTKKPIDSVAHLRAAILYVWAKQEPGAWCWRHGNNERHSRGR